LIPIAFSCGPKPKSGGVPRPHDLRIETSSHGATAYWLVDRGKSSMVFGYNIYLTEKSLGSEFADWGRNHPKPYNYTPYPGDTDGDRTKESFEFTNLENGKRYYVSVRTVGPGDSESGPSNEVSFVPLAHGTFELSSDHSAETGGFSFDMEKSMPARNPECDIYLYAKGDEVGLSSPSRLSGGLRKTWFGKPGINFFKEMDTIKIKKGDIITTSSKYGRSEMTIKKIRHSDGVTIASISYVFYPPDYQSE